MVLHSENLGGLALSPVLSLAQDRDNLAEKAIPRLLARAQSVDQGRATSDFARAQKAHWADVGSQSDVGFAEDRR